MNFPFNQKSKNGLLIREFSEHTNSEELVWHRDHSDRVIIVVEGSGWSLQMDNRLPVLLEAGRQYYIPKNTYHRVIKGSTKLVLEINETKSLLREYIRELITEKDDSAGPGERYVYRGMKIDMGSAGLAAQIRKVAQKKPAGISEREAGAFIMGMLNNEEIGESWSVSRDVAANFADVWEATNRGSTLHVMFTGKIPNEFGYDPTTTGEEPPMFEDESEVRIPKGEEIFISNVAVFIADKKGGKSWMKFKPVAFSLGNVRA